MRSLWWVTSLLVGLTTACASVEAPTKAAGTVAVTAPAPVPGYDWFLTPDEGVARLAYGVEASDDLRLGLDCVAGSGTVSLVANGAKGAKLIHLESGDETQQFPAEGEPSELHDGDLLTAQAEAAEPVLQRFRRLGWIAQRTQGRREVYAPHPGSENGIERFFAFCG